ncbi:uncharacterized protein LOC129907393 [Episyrphus balteatus]|uniref:uncharacterized protein LOC129907393 n=1 Tax=Episyrphus balteatus TaxID=286459 RepID=UPI002486A485|nr:uncharacterized protein LOC129907393 [Episyrphus balteatus]
MFHFSGLAFSSLISAVAVRFGYKFVGFVLVLLSNLDFTIEHDKFYMGNHRTENQNSLESCLGRFDVHSNTIIRTGESQAIGGKFLQGIELDTPAKCQRLCCETSDCDVYVFEEKNYGYCYLFQCGSPKNFHCKFTKHSNYTSALLTKFNSVLKTTPRPNKNVILTNISTQEKELISLKAMSEKYLTSLINNPPNAISNDNRRVEGVHIQSRNFTCGRFEFPCHSGECIAVYNACNGIPQCVDGSDEGPECLEPADINSNNYNRQHFKPEIVQNTSTYTQNSNMLENSHRAKTSILENRHNNLDEKKKEHIDESKILGNENGVVQNVLNLEQSNEKLFENQREINAELPKLNTEFPTLQIAEEKALNLNENFKWPTQQRQPYHSVTDAPQYSNTFYQPISKFEENHKHVSTINEEIKDSKSRLSNQDPQTKTRLQTNKDFEETNGIQMVHSEKNVKNSKKDLPLNDGGTPRPSISVKKAPHPAFLEQYNVMEHHLELKFTDHDGHSDKPRGAVFSLTLGLTITGVIVTLIACRLRTVGRWGNRHGGKTPYLPDEDFLVNGMYL